MYIIKEIERRDKIEHKINIGVVLMKNNFLFICSQFFISSIEMLLIIIPPYVYACDIYHYPTMSFIFQLLLLCTIILFTSQRNLDFLYFFCIWLLEKLFQTWQTFLLISKKRIWDSTDLVSTEVLFVVGFKYTIDKYKYFMIDITNIAN